jgi:hypothetical protein
MKVIGFLCLHWYAQKLDTIPWNGSCLRLQGKNFASQKFVGNVQLNKLRRSSGAHGSRDLSNQFTMKRCPRLREDSKDTSMTDLYVEVGRAFYYLNKDLSPIPT